MPTFYDFNLSKKVEYKSKGKRFIDYKNCDCKRFKRTLKYFMKGFYEKKKEMDELNQARLIFQELVRPNLLIDSNGKLGKCKYCNTLLASNLNIPVNTYEQLKIFTINDYTLY